MPELAPLEHCTGCGVCAFVCPKHCISLKSSISGTILPDVNLKSCIDCHACERVCPALNPPDFNKSKRVYAAWNNNEEIRHKSASGGIASAIYQYTLRHQLSSVGAVLHLDDCQVKVEAFDHSKFHLMQNSKYCYSDISQALDYIKQQLKEGKTIVAIGLPCQIAAYKKVFGDKENIIYIDLVCHGVAPSSYLKQHINHIEKLTGNTASRISFRAPEKGTANYYFTLYDNDNHIIYSKRSFDGDTYNIAFHRCLAYRENCYHCQYARPERCSDITLGDYHGLGVDTECSFSAEEVSVILVNTEKGERFIELLKEEGLIFTEQRPLEEPIKGDAQLRNPSPKPLDRVNFEKYIIKYNGDFEQTMAKILSIQRHRNQWNNIKSLPKRAVKKGLRILGLR